MNHASALAGSLHKTLACIVRRKAGVAGALLNIVESGPDWDADPSAEAADDDEVVSHTDVRFKDELASVIWILSVATSGNLLAIPSDATPTFARSLMQASPSTSDAHSSLIRQNHDGCWIGTPLGWRLAATC